MEVFVRGARSSSRDWSAAQRAPLDELPQLDNEQKAEARRGNLSEVAYARTLYAQQRTGQTTLQRLLKFGQWLNARVEERNPGFRVERVELDTLSGRIEIALSEGAEAFDFEMDEDLVERFLTAGSSEAESSIFRVLDVYVPRQQVSKAS
jgi:hypothetical protein